MGKWLVLGSIIAGGGCDAPSKNPADPRPEDTVALATAADETIGGPRGMPDQDGYVQTPAGRYHVSCVHELPDDSLVIGDEVWLGGRRIATIPQCQYPVRESTLAQAPRTSSVSNPDWGFYDEARAPTNAFGFDWYNGLTGRWTVPVDPPNDTGQTLYFFNAFTPGDGTKIIQPVLQWGPSPAGGGSSWAVAAFFVASGVCGSGACFGPLRNVSPGDRITASMVASSCTNAGACTWRISLRRIGGASSTLNVSLAESMQLTYKGVVEMLRVSGCNELSRTNPHRFDTLNLFQPGPSTGDFNEVAKTQTWTAAMNKDFPARGCLLRATDNRDDRSVDFVKRANVCACTNSGAGNICIKTQDECWPGTVATCSPRVGACGGCNCL
jgi:hypothetical protein